MELGSLSRILKLSYLQGKQQVNNIGFLLLIFFLFLGIFLPPYENMPEKTSIVFIRATEFCMLLLFSRILGGEFEYKTSKYIFTSSLTRLQVMIVKLITIVGLSLLLCFIYNLTVLVIQIFNTEEIVLSQLLMNINYSILHFLLYGLCLGTFILLISTITFSSVFSFLITYVFYGGMIQSLILLVGEKHRNEIIRELVQNTPFYIATYGFHNQSYTNYEMVLLLVSSILTFIIACLIIEKRDLR